MIPATKITGRMSLTHKTKQMHWTKLDSVIQHIWNNFFFLVLIFSFKKKHYSQQVGGFNNHQRKNLWENQNKKHRYCVRYFHFCFACPWKLNFTCSLCFCLAALMFASFVPQRLSSPTRKSRLTKWVMEGDISKQK